MSNEEEICKIIFDSSDIGTGIVDTLTFVNICRKLLVCTCNLCSDTTTTDVEQYCNIGGVAISVNVFGVSLT